MFLKDFNGLKSLKRSEMSYWCLVWHDSVPNRNEIKIFHTRNEATEFATESSNIKYYLEEVGYTKAEVAKILNEHNQFPAMVSDYYYTIEPISVTSKSLDGSWSEQ